MYGAAVYQARYVKALGVTAGRPGVRSGLNRLEYSGLCKSKESH